MFDNYIKIINKINERKKELKEKFEEEQVTEEKKIAETDLKARKQLLNIFLKGKSTYEVIRDNYKLIQTGKLTPMNWEMKMKGDKMKSNLAMICIL